MHLVYLNVDYFRRDLCGILYNEDVINISGVMLFVSSSCNFVPYSMVLPVAVDTVEHCTDDGRVWRPKHVE
jgi:hypothetical protein